MYIVRLHTGRDCYDKVEAANNSMTVSELINKLEQMPEDAKVIFSNDNGYTYGYLYDERVDDEPTKVSGLTSNEEDRIESAIEDAAWNVAEKHELDDTFSAKDIIPFFNEMYELSGLEDDNKIKAYALEYVKSYF